MAFATASSPFASSSLARCTFCINTSMPSIATSTATLLMASLSLFTATLAVFAATVAPSIDSVAPRAARVCATHAPGKRPNSINSNLNPANARPTHFTRPAPVVTSTETAEVIAPSTSKRGPRTATNARACTTFFFVSASSRERDFTNSVRSVRVPLKTAPNSSSSFRASSVSAD